ncbi:unnamed protein product [Cuscuta europaea]|uniref:Uncharacterized protein n=1 Tax=Cuscuta europaea TaxID=41803 RepID=A0A9P0ZQH7_CUSEU|nr:unnamed protein product [Cuscuta europaea]
MKQSEIPTHLEIRRLGVNLERVRDDEHGISFTHECLSKLPGVTPHYQWYQFKPNIFYTYVTSFFDVSTRDNKKYAKEKIRRIEAKEAKEKEKQVAKEGGGHSSTDSESYEF